MNGCHSQETVLNISKDKVGGGGDFISVVSWGVLCCVVCVCCVCVCVYKNERCVLPPAV